MNSGVIHPPKEKNTGHPPSPVRGYTCKNCPGYTGPDVMNIGTGMGNCRYEGAKMLGASGGGQIALQFTPTHPEWWCLQHPTIKAVTDFMGHQEAMKLMGSLSQDFLDTSKQEKAE